MAAYHALGPPALAVRSDDLGDGRPLRVGGVAPSTAIRTERHAS